jgi:hypothetical protein
MRLTIREPRKPLKFRITAKHIKKAVRKDPCNCVIAQALADTQRVQSCEVNACITTVIVRGGAERYQTPPDMRKGLENWDNGGDWDLPPGEYALLPVPPSQTKKAIREAARKRRANGDPNMFHDRSIYPRRKQNLSPRAITHRQLMLHGK